MPMGCMQHTAPHTPLALARLRTVAACTRLHVLGLGFSAGSLEPACLPHRMALDAAPVACVRRGRVVAALQRFGRDLTEEARRGLLDPLVGREDVLRRTLQVRSLRLRGGGVRPVY